MPRFSTCLLTVLAVLLTAGLLGCAAPESPTPPPVEVLDFSVVGQGQYADLDTMALATERVVREQAVWDSLASSLRPSQPFRTVTLEGDVLLLAAVPARGTGYSVGFEDVERIGDEVVARYVVTTPGEDCPSSPLFVMPFQVIRIAQPDVPIRFDAVQEPYPCTRGGL